MILPAENGAYERFVHKLHFCTAIYLGKRRWFISAIFAIVHSLQSFISLRLRTAPQSPTSIVFAGLSTLAPIDWRGSGAFALSCGTARSRGAAGWSYMWGRHFVHIDKSLTGMEENSEMML